jgi:hypothetical protein
MPKSPPTSIRLEEKLYARVITEAKKDKRSISNQIEFMIERYYEIMDSFSKPNPQSQIEKEAM